MASATSNCPRCQTSKIGFEVRSLNHFDGDFIELFSICNGCKTSTIFKSYCWSFQNLYEAFKSDKHLNEYMDEMFPVRIPPSSVISSPPHIPETIKSVFDEGALCFASNCPNAAAAMFRASIEQALKDVFSNELDASQKKLFTLFSKVKYLSECGLISENLVELADCIREDGNDALHECNVDANTAEDMQEFCTLILSKLYTEPAKIRIANERRKKRREEDNAET